MSNWVSASVGLCPLLAALSKFDNVVQVSIHSSIHSQLHHGAVSEANPVLEDLLHLPVSRIC